GIVRDVLLGDTPPAVFRDERYLAVCLTGAVAVIAFGRTISKGWNRVMLADAVGLGLFAAMGAAKGAAFGLGPLGTILAGALTAVGGGVIRDVLVGDRPAVLYKGYYATAALIGAATLVGLAWLGTPEALRLGIAAAVTTSLRLLELARNARLSTPA
ncbi:MAG: TRIC cation channel family protein, partial [Bacteroidota bacterium]